MKVNACEESEMAKVRLDCEFKTQEVEQDLALQLLTLHMSSKHQQNHFLYQFELYKDRLGGGKDSALLLRVCLATNISRTIFSNQW